MGRIDVEQILQAIMDHARTEFKGLYWRIATSGDGKSFSLLDSQALVTKRVELKEFILSVHSSVSVPVSLLEAVPMLRLVASFDIRDPSFTLEAVLKAMHGYYCQ